MIRWKKLNGLVEETKATTADMTKTISEFENLKKMHNEILEYAKLDFVIKMPENLFREQDRTVNTAIFGFTKTRHEPNDRTIFYNLKDDGLVSIQHKGRVDKFNKWEELPNVKAYYKLIKENEDKFKLNMI